MRKFTLREETESSVRSVSRDLKPARLSTSSLDDQIDSYIVKFEARAKEDKLNESLRKRDLRFLYEAEGDAPAPPPTKTEEAPKPSLNINRFGKQVARLVMNAESLLDSRTVIINRAAQFLEENYDQGVAKEMLDYLETQFDMTPTNEMQGDSSPLPPPAIGAFGGGGGGGA
jgi:hypothetical protein